MEIPIKEISSLAILVPLACSIWKLKTGELRFTLFFVFLLFGAFTDGFGWYIHRQGSSFYPHAVLMHFYSFFEAIFFTWLCSSFLKTDRKRLLRIVFFSFFGLLHLAGLVLFFSTPFDPYQPLVLTTFTGSVFLVVSAFLSAFALLHLAEDRMELTSYPWFWILSGIFIYTFGTFFIDILTSTKLMSSVWPIRNLVNIIQYGFFVVGLTKSEKG